MLDIDHYQVLTFDCYGTLIDWESGILRAIRPVLTAHGLNLADQEILQRYAALEAPAEAGPYQTYTSILGQIMDGFAAQLGFTPTSRERHCLADSLGNWPPFPDTVEALRRFRQRFRLGIVSNIDDALFARSAPHLQVTFDWVITAEHVQSYKPSLRNFTVALERLAVSKESILHVAQSLYHDIAPARQLGLATVWVNRRHGQAGTGATPPAEAQPDLEVHDLRTLVQIMGLAENDGS